MDFVWLTQLPWPQIYGLLLISLVLLLGLACSVALVELALVALAFRETRRAYGVRQNRPLANDARGGLV